MTLGFTATESGFDNGLGGASNAAGTGASTSLVMRPLVVGPVR